mmetsp:Transcript_15491/g.30925  ORF Transcript_15491/g.30925 Transcript_15491/m.30925 type:complete len:255 (+) Transcript_15491:127-891(+)
MTYSNSVCLGNWFEDRIQKKAQGGRIIADYGYRIFDTDASRSWGNPLDKVAVATKLSRAQKLKELASQKASGGFCMAQKNTYHESVADRRGKAPEEGFEAILPPSAKEPEKNFKTNNQFAMGEASRTSASSLRALSTSSAHYAGQSPKKKPRSNQPKSLSGEVWNGSTSDPQKSTLAQRSWMYCMDPAVRYKLSGYPVLSPSDVERTGLAVGEENELKDYDPEASHRRVATITKCSDERAQGARRGRHIFMDEM